MIIRNLAELLKLVEEKQCHLESGQSLRNLEVNLHQKSIGNDGAEAIAGALASGNCPYGLEIDLSATAIGDQGVGAIANALMTGACPEGLAINLAMNAIGDDAAIAIANALVSGLCPQGLSIDLRSTDINERGVQAMANALKSGKSPSGLKMCLCFNESLLENEVAPIADALVQLAKNNNRFVKLICADEVMENVAADLAKSGNKQLLPMDLSTQLEALTLFRVFARCFEHDDILEYTIDRVVPHTNQFSDYMYNLVESQIRQIQLLTLSEQNISVPLCDVPNFELITALYQLMILWKLLDSWGESIAKLDNTYKGKLYIVKKFISAAETFANFFPIDTAEALATSYAILSMASDYVPQDSQLASHKERLLRYLLLKLEGNLSNQSNQEALGKTIDDLYNHPNYQRAKGFIDQAVINLMGGVSFSAWPTITEDFKGKQRCKNEFFHSTGTPDQKAKVETDCSLTANTRYK